MGYNYEIEKSAGSELILVPDDPMEIETYPIEQEDIAEMIREMFYDSATKFTRDNLVEALDLYEAKKTVWQSGLFDLADAGYDLSMWAASINWRGGTNTAEWLEGLKERIEKVQKMYTAHMPTEESA